MEQSFSGKRALVTGASRGIGLAIAQRLAGEGARVVLNASRESDRLEAAAREIGGGALAVAADVADPAAVDLLFARIKQELGGLDVLVNNAAVTHDSLVMLQRPEDWRRVLAVGVDGAFHCSRAALRLMISGRYGRIVNLVSPAAFLGKPGAASYAAAKGALLAFTKSLAAEAARHHVTVNALCPGYVETDLIAGMPADERERLRRAIPLGRFATTGEIAEAALFLASESARYITGSTLVVDGGLTMH